MTKLQKKTSLPEGCLPEEHPGMEKECGMYLIFPASRSIFFCVHWADEYGKEASAIGSKLAVLSMYGGYLAS